MSLSEGLGELSGLSGALSAVGGPMAGVAGDVSEGTGMLGGLSGLIGTSGTGTRLPGSVVRARLADFVFAINPQSISIGKQSDTQGNKKPLVMSDFQESVKASRPMTISLSGIQLIGPNTMTDALYLIGLATPVPKAAVLGGLGTLGTVATEAEGTVGAVTGAVPSVTLNASSMEPAAGGLEDYTLAVVTFSWGMQLTRMVTVQRVDVNITRFSSLGMAISAEVGLQLLEWLTFAQPTNPTSGGLPGRAMHTVITGDSIVGIAVRNYGDASAWRAIAVANGLDDPLRVEPGQQLYLPGPAELADVLAGDQSFEMSGT